VPATSSRSDAAGLVERIDAQLRARGTPERAAGERAYLKSDPERFFGYADAMPDEREFFIRKAIGWVLRDTAKRRPDLVFEWLLPRAARASGVTVREAVKPLPGDQRAAILAART